MYAVLASWPYVEDIHNVVDGAVLPALILLDSLRPFFCAFDALMALPKQTSLPLIKTSQELLSLARRDALVGLARVQANICSADKKRPSQYRAKLGLVKEIQHAHTYAVKVRALVADSDGARIGLKGADDLVAQTRRQVECERGFRVGAA